METIVNSSYEQNVRDQYGKNTRTMKITIINLGLATIFLFFFGIINILNDEILGLFMIILGFCLPFLIYFYWKRNINARNIIVYLSGFCFFFIHQISIWFVGGQYLILVKHNYYQGLPLLSFSGWLLFFIFYNTIANLINEDTKQKFEFPNIIPSNYEDTT